MGMDGLLRARRSVLRGILNGIDDMVWNPATDAHLAAQFDVNRLPARAGNKAALQLRFGLEPDPTRPLFGVVSRLTSQKGIDLLLEVLPSLVAGGGQLVLLGSGDGWLEAGLRSAVAAHPGRIGVQLGYNEPLAHLIQGGSDALLVPSRFEPCGLTQLCALRYGALPIVARVGGLSDTVIDANEVAIGAGVATGFQFAPVDTAMLTAAIDRAFAVWRQPELWRRMQRNAMQIDVSWKLPAKQYAALYRELASLQSEPP
jgi:starch synthase